MKDRYGIRGFVLRSVVIAALACAGVAAGVSTASATQAEYDQGHALGLDAYLYGLPLVTTNKTFQNQTSVNVSNGQGFGPVNRFNPVRQFADPNAKAVVAPNYDTLYSIAWLNLKSQPMVIHVPKVKNRYFVIPLMDPYTEDFKNLGSVNRTKPGNYAVVGPKNYKKKLPKGVKRIKSTTNRVWIIERVFGIPGDKKDLAKVHKIQNQTTITPLNKFGKKGWKPKPPKKKDTKIDNPAMPTGLDFFNVLGGLLKRFPPPAADKPELQKLAAVGIGPGLKPADAGLSEDTLRGLSDAVTDGPATIDASVTSNYIASSLKHNGYLVLATGKYGTDYKTRASVTKIGLGALLPNEAVYPLAQTDKSLSPLLGSKVYRLHIDAGQLPPVRAFWSLSMYGSDGYFVPNSAGRYTISDRTDLHVNDDGSIDLWIQSTQPTDPDRAQNWLPSPPDGSKFRLIWRLYDTRPDQLAGVLDGTGWTPPAIDPGL